MTLSWVGRSRPGLRKNGPSACKAYAMALIPQCCAILAPSSPQRPRHSMRYPGPHLHIHGGSMAMNTAIAANEFHVSDTNDLDRNSDHCGLIDGPRGGSWPQRGSGTSPRKLRQRSGKSLEKLPPNTRSYCTPLSTIRTSSNNNKHFTTWISAKQSASKQGHGEGCASARPHMPS